MATERSAGKDGFWEAAFGEVGVSESVVPADESELCPSDEDTTGGGAFSDSPSPFSVFNDGNTMEESLGHAGTGDMRKYLGEMME